MSLLFRQRRIGKLVTHSNIILWQWYKLEKRGAHPLKCNCRMEISYLGGRVVVCTTQLLKASRDPLHTFSPLETNVCRRRKFSWDDFKVVVALRQTLSKGFYANLAPIKLTNSALLVCRISRGSFATQVDGGPRSVTLSKKAANIAAFRCMQSNSTTMIPDFILAFH